MSEKSGFRGAHDGHSGRGNGEELAQGQGCGCMGEHEEHGDGCGCSHGGEAAPGVVKAATVAGGVIIVLSLALPEQPLASVMMAAGTVFIGYPLFLTGLKSLARLQFDELTLLTVAVGASFGLAAAAADPLEGVLEAAAVTVLFRIGNLLESRAVKKGKREIEALTAIRPDRATVISPDGAQLEMPAEAVPVGAVVLLRAGDRAPIDCEVITGGGFINLSAITGESMPIQAMPGTALPSGAINTDGLLTCRTTASFGDSTVSRIIRLVRESSASKGKSETLIARFARGYTPMMMALAAALAFLPPLLGFGSLSVWLSRALVVLVASCPCALVISVPLTFFAGVGAASKAGVLLKGTKYVEILAKADCVVMDKTGTLTRGIPAVRGMEIYGDFDREKLLAVAKSAEKESNHPAAKAIAAFAVDSPELPVSSYTEHPGRGVELNTGGQRVLCGSKRLLEEMGVDTAGLPEEGVSLAVDGRAACSFTLTDKLRPEAVQAVDKLHALGIENITMLTGDNEKTAREIAAQLGIDYRAQLLPHQKLEQFKRCKGASRAALFVGDGINDAPTLAAADAGVAMGLGTDTAIEAADVVLMREQLTALPDAVRIARITMRKAWVNIVFALGVKAVVLVLGALGMASMWMAVFADVGVGILAVLNAVTVLHVKSASARGR